MSKKALSERDICSKFITPALVSAIVARNYNLDVKNPHETDEAHRDPAELLAEYQAAQAAVAQAREKLRQELESALLR